VVWDDPDEDEMSDDGEHELTELDEEEEPSWAEGGAHLHLFGKRIQGFAFSPKAPLSAAWYDKAREERTSGKSWMLPIHQAGG
jgi:hypothetical protein